MTRAFVEGINACMLADGKRLSLRHGPIDLIIEADGQAAQVAKAYKQARAAFESVLTDLVAELSELRKPINEIAPQMKGKIAVNMHSAASTVSYAQFVTPMIAVAGAVADYMLNAMISDTQLKRAYVNNGGDIAIYLGQSAKFDIGICADIRTGELMSKAQLTANDNIGGIATSGWQGRSHSLGIADAVTVLASNAATADTAATLIANAINLPEHANIRRVAANELAPDSDLGEQAVTVDVGELSSMDIETALSRGKQVARSMLGGGSINAVYANLQNHIFSLSQGDTQIHPHSNQLAESNPTAKELSFA